MLYGLERPDSAQQPSQTVEPSKLQRVPVLSPPESCSSSSSLPLSLLLSPNPHSQYSSHSRTATPLSTPPSAEDEAAQQGTGPSSCIPAEREDPSAALPGRQSWERQNGPGISTGTARPFRCERDCNASFPSRRELQRHYQTSQHQPALYNASSSESYTSLQCACGKIDPRRDNHKRHVKICQRPAIQPFRCDRGHTATDKTAWLDHLDDPECKPPRGRPRRHAQP
ncbi:hypothetical protein QQS21_008487 [Conoideocrella luteorostrata]|uniref:C2H2-type domain-containing protein n=1 Tax=Conoideocrella luteorostrata TaxID=1105319 RepID=A0AAJ0CIZ6_9HYPO|nr:hypothetical protein QQS21_008487 [Conoideocrella luteorostrata]